jgi:PAS domain S-box-containing protein
MMRTGPFGLPAWLSPVVPVGYERQSLSRTLRIVYVAVLVAALATIGRFDSPPERNVFWLMAVALCAALVINHRGSPEWAARIGLMGILTYGAVTAWSSPQGFRTIYLSLLACLLIVAALLLRPLPYSVFAALVLAIVAAVGMKEIRFVAQGGQIHRGRTTYTLIFDVEIIFSVGALAGGLLAGNLYGSLRKVRETARELEVANTALQSCLEAQRSQVSALRQSEERHRMLAQALRSASECISITDIAGRLVYVNNAFLQTYGYREHELIGQYIDVVRSGRSSAEVVDGILPATIAGGWSGELSNRTKEGREFPVFLTTSAVYDEDGQRIALVGIARDITERKRVEETYLRLVTAIEQAAETIVITDPAGAILYANPAFEKTSGFTCAEALGRNPRILKSGKQGADFYRNMWVMLAAGQVWSGHFINKRKDGTLYQEEATISPVRDATGKIINYVAVKRDVTRELALEEQYRQAQKMESIGRLAGGIAHDFNNLLTVINGYSKMILAELRTDNPLRDQLEEIEKAGECAAGLTRQLLAFSRKQILQPCVLDLNGLVRDMQGMLERLMGEDVEVRYAFHPEDVTVHADRHQLEQVIMNLAVNARDAMPDGGQLLIETALVDESRVSSSPEARPGRYAMLAVSDTGTGMDEATERRIFEPFFTTKPIGQGTGLGLAMVQGIVAQSGGYINVYSEPGQGTAFKIYLPALAGAKVPAEQAAVISALQGWETILVVEDQVEVRNFAVAALQEYGYRVMQAPGAVEVQRICELEGERIHLVLTDVVMPHMSGRELTARLVAMRPEIKVLYMSGYTDNVVVHRGVLEEGANFIQKPFSAEELARKVREALGPDGS